MTCIAYFLVFVALIQHTLAHFELTFPPSKGVAKDTGFIPPCGGYDIASEKRTLLPLETPFVEINSDHELYNYRFKELNARADYICRTATRLGLYTSAHATGPFQEEGLPSFNWGRLACKRAALSHSAYIFGTHYLFLNQPQPAFFKESIEPRNDALQVPPRTRGNCLFLILSRPEVGHLSGRGHRRDHQNGRRP